MLLVINHIVACIRKIIVSAKIPVLVDSGRPQVPAGIQIIENELDLLRVIEEVLLQQRHYGPPYDVGDIRNGFASDEQIYE